MARWCWWTRPKVRCRHYDLQWKDVQTFLFLGDGAVFNVPTARSRGAEFEAQLRPLRPLTFNAAIAYTKAEYTSSLSIPAGPGSRAGNLVIAQNGQAFAQPRWTVDLGARYEVAIGSSATGYARVDYRWFDGLFDCPGRYRRVLARLEQGPGRRRTSTCGSVSSAPDWM